MSNASVEHWIATELGNVTAEKWKQKEMGHVTVGNWNPKKGRRVKQRIGIKRREM